MLRQLPGWHNDDGEDVVSARHRRRHLEDEVEQRHCVGKALAAAGLGLDQRVCTLQQRRDGPLLHHRQLLQALLLQLPALEGKRC